MITVTHHRDDDVAYTNRHVWPLRSIAASDNAGDAAIFVYKNIKDEYTGEVLGEFFLGIASPDQMTDLSENTSDDMYRVSELRLNILSDDEREMIASDLDMMLDDFNENMYYLELLQVGETINAGES